jgi:hypothetical protein
MPRFGSIEKSIGLLLACFALVGCGASHHLASTIGPNENSAGVRARLYAFYRDERTNNTAAACASTSRANQIGLAKEEKVSSCQAAFFKIWNTHTGIYSEAEQTKHSTEVLNELEAEIPKDKIIVVGDRATVIRPKLEETAEYAYRGGQWIYEKSTKNTEAAEDLKREAEETEAKNEAVKKAAEAQESNNEIKEQATGEAAE